MRRLVTALVLLGAACGGDTQDGGEVPAPPPAEARAPAPTPPALRTEGATHEVRMLGTPDGRYLYQPAALVVRMGDRVRWINVSGGPHNVAFYRDSIPAGATDFLNATMPDRMGDLTGALLFEPNAVYELSFAGAPAGTYVYFCTPHEMLGMQAKLTVIR
jgi:plastocyanin